MQQYNIQPQWQKLSVSQRRGVVLKLLDELDLSQRVLRMKAARCILYLAQVCVKPSQIDLVLRYLGLYNICKPVFMDQNHG